MGSAAMARGPAKTGAANSGEPSLSTAATVAAAAYPTSATTSSTQADRHGHHVATNAMMSTVWAASIPTKERRVASGASVSAIPWTENSAHGSTASTPSTA